MTETPAYHYQRADELIAELEQTDPRIGMSLPHVQLKFRLAELHALLAQSPWWPGIEAETGAVDPEDAVAAFGIPTRHLETRTAKEDLL
ncbi:hypothetical protein I5J49_gp55 [Mycobacterium phage ThulaThula]|uniref:Uncharacterized protein n=1 Tax=Mycobacterium phage ThulaThula TaxID=2599880 RepID=A0A5J6TDT7_9CAUD|nr:hypothetical protein I5J49_gp55 [Mycobacterium phage ThulaThula]QFG09083.1 hypothetical protein PBI_THULATHULA_55 [Mycobacterium phage ThulaThula]